MRGLPRGPDRRPARYCGGQGKHGAQEGSFSSGRRWSAALTAAPFAAAATFTVTTTADTGAGSLRQAILDANAAAGPDTIQFSVVPARPDHDPAGDSPLSWRGLIDGTTQRRDRPADRRADGTAAVAIATVSTSAARASPCGLDLPGGSLFGTSTRSIVRNSRQLTALGPRQHGRPEARRALAGRRRSTGTCSGNDSTAWPWASANYVGIIGTNAPATRATTSAFTPGGPTRGVGPPGNVTGNTWSCLRLGERERASATGSARPDGTVGAQRHSGGPRSEPA